MKHEIAAGTDVASLLLFDPLALPEDFDTTSKSDDPLGFLNNLHDQQRLFWINTGSDGAYLLHAFVDEDVPVELKPYLHDPMTADSFTVVSGRIFFAGAEYGYREDDSPLKSYPSMGGSFPVENGTYSITLYRTDYPDGLHEERFQQRATRAQQLAHGSFGYLIAIAALTVIVAGIGFFMVSWSTWFMYFLPAVLVAIGLPMLCSGLPVYQSAEKIWQTVNNELPSLVAILVRKTSV